MSKTLSTVLKVSLSVLLALLVLYLVFRKIDPDAFVAKAEKVNYLWVVITMIIGTFGYLLRAYRWKLQLEPLGYSPSTFRMFLAVMSGYLANLLIPRLGEVARCATLYKSDTIPVAKSFGSVVTERIVDVLALVVILIITFFLQSAQLSSFIDQTVNFNVDLTLIAGIGIAVLGIGAFVFFKWIYPSKTKIGEFSRGLIAGLISLKDVRIGWFLLSTVGIWVIYFLMTYLMVFALDETASLGLAAGFAILSAGVIAFVLPVQSGFGTFHALVSTMLLLYNIDQLTGVFFATLLHASQLLVVLILGLLAGIVSIFIQRNEESRENTE